MSCHYMRILLTAGICAEKALVQFLCERFHDPGNVQVFILSISVLTRHKFCIQKVLLHICLPSFPLNIFSRLNGLVFLQILHLDIWRYKPYSLSSLRQGALDCGCDFLDVICLGSKLFCLLIEHENIHFHILYILLP